MIILSIIDECTMECLTLKAARSVPARGVIDALEEVMAANGRKPQYLRSDSGPEPSGARSPAASSPKGEAQPRQFTAKSVRKRLEEAQIGPRYIEPGSPWENAHVEDFHAQVRLELLDRELFLDLREVKRSNQRSRLLV